MIACVSHVIGELWFWVLFLAVAALPVAALAHLNGEHTERRRQQLARRHPCVDHVRIIGPGPEMRASDARLALAAANERHGTCHLIDQEAEGW